MEKKPDIQREIRLLTRKLEETISIIMEHFLDTEERMEELENRIEELEDGIRQDGT